MRTALTPSTSSAATSATSALSFGSPVAFMTASLGSQSGASPALALVVLGCVVSR
jgi:hypothetical protein